LFGILEKTLPRMQGDKMEQLIRTTSMIRLETALLYLFLDSGSTIRGRGEREHACLLLNFGELDCGSFMVSKFVVKQELSLWFSSIIENCTLY